MSCFFWSLCNEGFLFSGLGWSMGMVSGICCTYYNVIIGWVLYYLFQSFTKTLPWANCRNGWNTELCLQKKSCVDVEVDNSSLKGQSNFSLNGSSLMCSQEFAAREIHARESHNLSSNASIPWRSPAEEYWQ